MGLSVGESVGLSVGVSVGDLVGCEKENQRRRLCEIPVPDNNGSTLNNILILNQALTLSVGDSVGGSVSCGCRFEIESENTTTERERRERVGNSSS